MDTCTMLNAVGNKFELFYKELKGEMLDRALGTRMMDFTRPPVT